MAFYIGFLNKIYIYVQAESGVPLQPAPVVSGYTPIPIGQQYPAPVQQIGATYSTNTQPGNGKI